jgi:hypothetical protein
VEGGKMKIVTAKFQKTIQDLIDNLHPEQFPDAEEYRLAQKYRALPLGFDLLDYVFLTPNGEVLWEGCLDEVGSVNNTQSLIRVLVSGSRRYPPLTEFIPPRSGESKDCPVCEGSGVWRQSKDIVTDKPTKCFFCAGLGWVTEEFWKEFTENQKLSGDIGD